MKKVSLILILIFLSLSACDAQVKNQSLDWKEFISEEGKFKVTFPGTPVKSIREKDAPSGKVLNPWFEVTLPQSYFALLYADLPDESIPKPDALNAFYDNIRDGLISFNFKLVTEREIKLEEKVGRELVFTSPDGITLKTRLYLIGKRQFQLITTFDLPPKGTVETGKNVDKFLDSFKFTGK
jgi:hypothetical protein